MGNDIYQFEKIAYQFSGRVFGLEPRKVSGDDHPFDTRNIHPAISNVSKKLFDDGYYRQATLDAFISIEELVKRNSKIEEKVGWPLMMDAFGESEPNIALNPLSNDSEKEEQRGYRHIFAGCVAGIRNPRAHSIQPDTIDECLDNLSIASALMRKIDNAPEK